MGLFEAILLSVIAASTPLLLAASGELVVERSGVLNLAIAGAAAGAGMAAIFALLTLGLAVNQDAAGLALTIFGIGLSGLIGANFVGERIDQAAHLHIPVLTDIPLIGRILFGEDAFVYLSILLVVGIWWFLYRTHAGLVLRAVGDNHASAHALGYPVLKIRALAVL